MTLERDEVRTETFYAIRRPGCAAWAFMPSTSTPEALLKELERANQVAPGHLIFAVRDGETLEAAPEAKE